MHKNKRKRTKEKGVNLERIRKWNFNGGKKELVITWGENNSGDC